MIAILLAIALGGTPIGAPIVGWVADTFGPRWALGAGAVSGLLAATVAIIYLARRRHPEVDAGPKAATQTRFTPCSHDSMAIAVKREP